MRDDADRLRGEYLVARDTARRAEKAFYTALRTAIELRRKWLEARLEAIVEASDE